MRWYGVWLFVAWLGYGGPELDPTDTEQVEPGPAGYVGDAIAANAARSARSGG